MALLMQLTCLAASPVGHTTTKSITRRSVGDMTFYNPGLGACGSTDQDGDLVVAVDRVTYDKEKACGRSLRVKYEGKEVTVKVVDKCMGCKVGDLDLSPAAFKQVIGDLGKGRVKAEWAWV